MSGTTHRLHAVLGSKELQFLLILLCGYRALTAMNSTGNELNKVFWRSAESPIDFFLCGTFTLVLMTSIALLTFLWGVYLVLSATDLFFTKSFSPMFPISRNPFHCKVGGDPDCVGT